MDGKRSGKDWSRLYRELDIKDLGEFLDAFLVAALPHVNENAAIYLWHAHLQQPVIAQTFDRHGLLLHQVLVWVKPVSTFSHSCFNWHHESCAFGWRHGHASDRQCRRKGHREGKSLQTRQLKVPQPCVARRLGLSKKSSASPVLKEASS